MHVHGGRQHGYACSPSTFPPPTHSTNQSERRYQVIYQITQSESILSGEGIVYLKIVSGQHGLPLQSSYRSVCSALVGLLSGADWYTIRLGGLRQWEVVCLSVELGYVRYSFCAKVA